MPLFTDQLERTIWLDHPAKRIVSVVPSQTELLYDLGLREEVAGITKFCIHPHELFQAKTRVGGTKQLHLEKIRELRPDLVLANKEENLREHIEELSKEFPVWVSDVNTLPDALEMITSIGEITGRSEEAEQISTSIKQEFAKLKPTAQKLRTCYLIWQEPYMTVGGDTFIHAMLEMAGFTNVFASRKRYPEISLDEIQQADCEVLFLSSEPYPFRQKHADEIRTKLPGIKVLLADGEMFSWYGSRMRLAPGYFQQLQNQILSLDHAGTR